MLSAVATTAGSLTSPAGVVARFSRAFVATAIVAVLLAVVAFAKMPSTRATGGGNLHTHRPERKYQPHNEGERA